MFSGLVVEKGANGTLQFSGAQIRSARRDLRYPHQLRLVETLKGDFRHSLAAPDMVDPVLDQEVQGFPMNPLDIPCEDLPETGEAMTDLIGSASRFQRYRGSELLQHMLGCALGCLQCSFHSRGFL